MAVRLRLVRMGKKKQPTYRVVAADARSPRDGRFIEIIGFYEPRRDPSVVRIDNERALHWLRHGAQPSDRVEKLLRISGAWDAFKAAPKAVPAADSSAATGAVKAGDGSTSVAAAADGAVTVADGPTSADSSATDEVSAAAGAAVGSVAADGTTTPAHAVATAESTAAAGAADGVNSPATDDSGESSDGSAVAAAAAEGSDSQAVAGSSDGDSGDNDGDSGDK